MKTYYGQMTKEQLKNVKFKFKNESHCDDFMLMCLESGVEPVPVKMNDGLYVITSPSYSGLKEIQWKPAKERPSIDLKSQLSEAIAKRDKRKAKAQKATEKLEQSESEVQRLIAELETDVESIGVSCKITEVTEPEIPDGVDIDDPKTWKSGDIIECVSIYSDEEKDWFVVGNEYVYVYDGTCHCVTDDEEGDECAFEQTAKFRFVRRP